MPQTDGKSLDPSLTSKEMYHLQMSRFLSAQLDFSKPGFNYTFLKEQYPVPTHHRDLEEQVTAFLEMNPPKDPPKETLWIFSFGIWDVWHLAALPRSAGETALDGMTKVLFTQVERLYEASLVETSPAFSDFWGFSEPSLLEKVANRTGIADSRREREVFRLLVPSILDPSLTPAWDSLRPSPPAPHSKAEHVKNAAYLTSRWNANVQEQMDGWKRSRPAQHPPVVVRPANDNDDGDRAEARKRSVSTEDEQDDILVVPYPKKEGRVFDAPGFVLDTIIERQLRSTNLQDHLHAGNRSESEPIHYREVKRPCSADATPTQGRMLQVLTGMRTGADAQPCKEPGQHLFYTPFTIAARGIREIAGRAADLARRELYLAEDADYIPGSAKVKRGSEASFINAARPEIR